MQLTDALIKNLTTYGETAPATIAVCRELACVTLALLGDDVRHGQVVS